MPTTAEGGSFKFEIPQHRPGYSSVANVVIQMGAVATRLTRENRTLVDHSDGRAENVSEHANMLARIAPVVAAMFYIDLDPGLVSLFATIHDDLEAYVGDTPTHEITAQGLVDKEELEAFGMRQLELEYKHIPFYVRLIHEYQWQVSPESRFVRVLDKLMPYVVHLIEDDEAAKLHWTKEELIAAGDAKAKELAAEYPEYEQLIAARQELVALCAEMY